MAMNGNEGGSAYPPNPDVKSGSCLIAGFQPLTVVHPSYWNAYKTESGATFSIDMVRLKLSFINGKGEWLSEHAQTFDCDSMSAWTIWCVFHAMVPPTKKFKRELGWR